MRRFDVKPTERTSPRERPWEHWAIPRSVRRLVARVVFALLICAVVSFYAAIVIQHANPPVIAVQAGSTGSPLSNGDLALLQGVTPSSLRDGDVIAVAVPPDLQTRFHLPPHVERSVVGIVHTAHGLRFATEARSVSGRKPFEVLPSQILGEVVGSIPLVGYVFLFFGSLLGDIVLALLAGAGTTYLFTRRRTTRLRTTRRRTGRRPILGRAVMLGELIAQVQETGNQSRASAAALQELVGAVSDYGAHLRSHTAVLRHLAATTEQLQVAATRLADTVAAGRTTHLTQPSPEQPPHASEASGTAGQPETAPPPAAVHGQHGQGGQGGQGGQHGQGGQGTRRLVIDAEAWREPFTASELRHPNLARTANRYVADTVDRLLDRAADALDLAERERNSLRDRLSVVEARLALLAARRERGVRARTGQDEEAVHFTHAPPVPGPTAPPAPGAAPAAPAAPARPGPLGVPPVWEVTPLLTR